MKNIRIIPKIHLCGSFGEFSREFQVGSGDLILTSRHMFSDYMSGTTNGAKTVFLRDFGSGEPSDEMVEKLYESIRDVQYRRVIGIGGGTVLDVAKLLALDYYVPVADVYDKKITPHKSKILILIPTTCGTGSEVTNVSVMEIKEEKTKMGLNCDDFFADDVVLIPQVLEKLPLRPFVASSIDAFIHCTESYLAPKASPVTRLFSREGMRYILQGYQYMKEKDPEKRNEKLKTFLLGSLYGGIAFGNTGCGAVHAMSMPLGSAYHVPHGESNYEFFSAVFSLYTQRNPHGDIEQMNSFLAEILGCSPENVYRTIDALFGMWLRLKPLREYGIDQKQLKNFTENVMTKQRRLLVNSYIPMDYETVYGIYHSLL